MDARSPPKSDMPWAIKLVTVISSSSSLRRYTPLVVRQLWSSGSGFENKVSAHKLFATYRQYFTQAFTILTQLAPFLVRLPLIPPDFAGQQHPPIHISVVLSCLESVLFSPFPPSLPDPLVAGRWNYYPKWFISQTSRQTGMRTSCRTKYTVLRTEPLLR